MGPSHIYCVQGFVGVLLLIAGSGSCSGLATGRQLNDSNSLSFARYLTTKYGSNTNFNLSQYAYTGPMGASAWLKLCGKVLKDFNNTTLPKRQGSTQHLPLQWSPKLPWKSTLEDMFKSTNMNPTIGVFVITAFNDSILPCEELLANNTETVILQLYFGVPTNLSAAPYSGLKVFCDPWFLGTNRTCDVFSELQWNARNPKPNHSWFYLPATKSGKVGAVDQWRVGVGLNARPPGGASMELTSQQLVDGMSGNPPILGRLYG